MKLISLLTINLDLIINVMIDLLFASVYSLISPKAIFGRRYVASTIIAIFISLVCLALFIWIVHFITLNINNIGVLIVTIVIFSFNFLWVWIYASKPLHQAKIDLLLTKYPGKTLKTFGILFIIFCYLIFVATGIIVTILK
jgi:hypothetical protein